VVGRVRPLGEGWRLRNNPKNGKRLPQTAGVISKRDAVEEAAADTKGRLLRPKPWPHDCRNGPRRLGPLGPCWVPMNDDGKQLDDIFWDRLSRTGPVALRFVDDALRFAGLSCGG
jgi:hypothetical protein